jgi:hypothetical protein
MVCKVWVTMLALQDSDHVVRKNLYQLGRAARKKEEEVAMALAVLSSPDTKRKGQEYEGRRVQKVDGGWLILNGQYYEEMMRRVSRQVYQAKWARENRAKKAQGARDSKAEVSVKSLDDHINKGTPLHEDQRINL